MKKEVKELKMPLSVYMDKISQDTMDLINKSELDIYLKYIVVERVFNAVSEALQNQRLQYQKEQEQKDGDKDGNSETE